MHGRHHGGHGNQSKSPSRSHWHHEADEWWPSGGGWTSTTSPKKRTHRRGNSKERRKEGGVWGWLLLLLLLVVLLLLLIVVVDPSCHQHMCMLTPREAAKRKRESEADLKQQVPQNKSIRIHFFHVPELFFPSPFKHRFCQGSEPCAQRCWPQRPISVQWLAWRCIFVSWVNSFSSLKPLAGCGERFEGMAPLGQRYWWQVSWIYMGCICVLGIFQLSNLNYMFIIFAWPQAWRDDLSREDHRRSPSRKGCIQTRFWGIDANFWYMYIANLNINAWMPDCLRSTWNCGSCCQESRKSSCP